MAYTLPGRPDRTMSAAYALMDKANALVQNAFNGAATDPETAMEEAISYLQQSHTMMPGESEITFRLGYASYLLMDRSDRPERCLELSILGTQQFKKLLKGNPHDERALDLIADTLFRQATLSESPQERMDCFDEAIQHMEHLLSLNTKDIEMRGKVFASLGLTYAHRGANSDAAEKLPRFQNAVRCFEAAIECGTFSFSMRYNYATALMDVGKNSPDTPTTNEYYERSLRVLTDAVEQLDQCQIAAKQDTGNEVDEEVMDAVNNGTADSFRYNYACLLSRMRKDNEAIRALKQLIAADKLRINDIVGDADFDPIRHLKAFKKLLGK